MASGLEKAKTGFLCLTLLVALAVLALSVLKLMNDNKHNDSDKTTTSNPSNNDKTTSSPPRPDPNNNNILPPKPIDKNASPYKYEAYKSYADDLKHYANFTYDPCNNFYEYTCAQTKTNAQTLKELEEKNYEALVKALNEGKNEEFYARKIKKAFQICVDASQNSDLYPKSADIIKKYFDYNNYSLQLPFPSLDNKTDIVLPTPTHLANIVAGIHNTYFEATLLDYTIDTAWKQPFNLPRHYKPVYQLFIDQSKTFYPRRFYENGTEEEAKKYKESVKMLVKKGAEIIGKKVDEEQLNKDVNEAYEFEKTIAVKINTDDQTRKNFERSYNVETVPSFQNNLIDFKTYIKEITQVADEKSKSRFQNDTYKFVIMEPEAFNLLADFISQTKPATFYNYLNYRTLLAISDLFPDNENVINDIKELQSKYGNEVNRHDRKNKIFKNSEEDFEIKCARLVTEWMPEAASRLFIAAIHPFAGKTYEIERDVTQITAEVIVGFQNQLNVISWLSPKAKQVAYNKLQYVARNIGYSPLINSNSNLNLFYENLVFEANSTLLKVKQAVYTFRQRIQFSKILLSHYDRSEWPISALSTDSWSSTKLNAIFIPFALLQKPIYDINYPASIKFGALGHLIGHELIHLFDDNGVQWDSYGRLHSWLDEKSEAAFQNMTKCLVKQYSKLDAGWNLFIDGEKTLAENMADNGGLRVAYNSFQTYQEFYGQDERLPDIQLQAFNHEQLFFLSFARSWCANPTKQALTQYLETDNHSPPKYRVFGSLQNFPAFRTAFNCPVGAKYAPKKSRRCDVWASDVEPVRGVPTLPEFDPSVEIQPPAKNRTYIFRKFASQLTEKLYLDVTPCNNFYEYSCLHTRSLWLAEEASENANYAVVRSLEAKEQPTYARPAKMLYENCKSTLKNGPEYIKEIFDEMTTFADVPDFPLVNNIQDVELDDMTLAVALFFLSTTHRLNLIYKFEVEPNTKQNYLGAPYLFQFGAPSVLFKPYVYDNPAVLADAEKDLAGLLLAKIKFVWPEEAKKLTVEDVRYQFIENDIVPEYLHEFNSNINRQKKYRREQLEKEEFSKTFAFSSLIEVYNGYFESIGLDINIDDKTSMIVQDIQMFKNSQNTFNRTKTDKKRAAKLINYLYLRLLLQYQHLIPCDTTASYRLEDYLNDMLIYHPTRPFTANFLKPKADWMPKKMAAGGDEKKVHRGKALKADSNDSGYNNKNDNYNNKNRATSKDEFVDYKKANNYVNYNIKNNNENPRNPIKDQDELYIADECARIVQQLLPPPYARLAIDDIFDKNLKSFRKSQER